VQALVEHNADLLAASATMAYHLPAMIDLITAVHAEPALTELKIMVGGRLFDAEPDLWQRVGADGHVSDADEACRLAERLMLQDVGGRPRLEHRILEMRREAAPHAPASVPDTFYDEMGRVNSEVVALNRELVRKNAEVERLHAEVSRQAVDLAASDRRKNEFLAMLGHELRNPLAPLRNALTLLGPDNPDPETVRWARDLMGRQVGQMVRLVDDLLDLSRIMQGKLEIHLKPVQLTAIIANAVETARPVIDAKSHALTISLPAEPVTLNADSIRLSQAITNLLTNAAKYSEPNGHITLTARGDGPEVTIRVGDSGLGISPEALPHLFDLFMQEGSSANLSQGGLGVGLALVKSLVEIHGGVVEARSDGLGKGSEFLIRLPAPAMKVGGDVPPPELTEIWKSTDSRWPRRRILVVDDNEDSANALGRLLTRLYDQEVKVVHDGPSALAAAKSFLPEVVLLDIGLPGMNGYEVARQMRLLPGFATVTLLALTGWGQEQDRLMSLEAGFDRHLVKPVAPEAILELLLESRKVES
jgi:signal transduction histidine kinase/ActR/RegA family two-component response regulator